MDRDVQSAVASSVLRDLPADALDHLMTGAVRARIPAGSVTHWEGDQTPHLELVLSGVVRVFVTSRDGRTMTVRYCRTGALMGAMSLFAAEFSMPATTQALVDAELLRISPALARQAATQDIRLARALLRELSERAQSFVAEISGGAFATVRQRMARHLLDLASDRVSKTGDELVVPISQRELAEAVGTVREVVVRVLRDLRQEGVVRTEHDRIVIVDPARLIHEHGWNTGS